MFRAIPSIPSRSTNLLHSNYRRRQCFSTSPSSCPFQILGLKKQGGRSKRSSSSSNNPLLKATSSISIRSKDDDDGGITYEQVRVAFRKLALRHHPDVVNNNSSNDDGSNNHIDLDGKDNISSKRPSSVVVDFTTIRAAFESIKEGPNGMAILRDDYSTYFESSQSSNDENNGKNEMNIQNNSRTINDYDYPDESHGFLHRSVNPQILREVAKVSKEMNPGGLDRGGMWQYANMIRNMEEKGQDLPPLRVDGGEEGKEGKRLNRRRRRK